MQYLIIISVVCISLSPVVADAETETVSDVTEEPVEVPKQTRHEIQHVDGMQWQVQYKPADCHEISDLGDRLEVHYTGFLENGMIFDSSIGKKRPPIGFTLGAKQVIEGWEKGLIGMCVGERRRLIVPSDLAYGDVGYPPSIPPRAKLLFEVTLMTLKQRDIWSHHIESGVNMIKLVGLPIVVVYLIFFLWSRYKTEVAEQKDEKKRSRKRK